MVEASDLQRTAAALSIVFALGACSFPLLRLSRLIRAAALTLLAIPVFLAPLLVRVASTELRLVVSLMSIMIGVKLYDLHRTVETGPPPGAWEFFTYLPNACNLVLRRGGRRNRPGLRADTIRLLWLIPTTIACGLLVAAVWQVDWRRYPWIIEHCAKVIAICAFIQFSLNIVPVAWRLAGVTALDFSGWFFAAATPAEFWRRWNQPAGQFMREYLFVPTGGIRALFLAVMVTFVFNGLLHEYVFDIAAGRVLGWAVLFFVIQGLATIATMRLRPRGYGKAIGILLTLFFNLVTSLLIFACVDAVVPFYSVR